MLFGFDMYELDFLRLELKRQGEPIRADRMVLRLLGTLIQQAGQLVTKAELIARVWDGRAVSENVVSVAVARLRKTLGHKAGEREFVATVQGSGYRFVCPVTRLDRGLQAASGAFLATSGTSQALVGREPIMRRLHASLAAARDRHGSVCLLTGKPGIGKTTVAERLALEAEASGTTVLWAHCAEVGEAPPLWPFTQLVRALLGRDGPLESDAPALVSELCWLLPELSPGGSPRTPPVAKHFLFEAILGLLERVAGPAGCVLLFDDLHRADAASLELLRYWMDRIGRTRVLLVATLRDLRSAHPVGELDLGYVVGHRNCTRLALAPLEPEHVHAYVGSILPDPDGALARAVWAKSEGNPFFMVELARQLADAPRPDARSLRVSAQALELLTPRIVQLDAAARGVLSTAAVIGRRFELHLLQRVTGQELEALIALLDAAVESEALSAAAEASTAFAFGHELIRKVLYDGLSPQARRKLHLAVGKTLVQLAAEGEVVPSAVLAYHFHAALPDSDPLATVGHCQRAAYEATQVFAYGDSLDHVRHALEALSLVSKPSPRARFVLLLQQAVASRMAAVPGFERAVQDAAQVARAMGSGAGMITVALLLHLQPGFAMPQGARALLEEGLSMLPSGERVHRAAALARLASCGPVAYDASRSQAQLAHALELVQGGSDAASDHEPILPGYDEVLCAYNVYSAAHYLAGGPAQGTRSAEAAEQIERLCRVNPRVLRAAPTLLQLHAALLAHQAGQLDVAAATIAQVRRRCQELGAREFAWYAERYQLLTRLHHADVAAITADLRVLHERARRESIVASELMCVFDEVVLLGDAVDPLRLQRVLAYSPDDPPSIWSIKVQTLAAAGLCVEAAASLAEVPADALASLPRDRDYLGTLGALAQAALTLDARAHLAALYTLLAPHTDALAIHVSFSCLGPIASLRGALACALGLYAEAARHFELGARVAERLGMLIHEHAARGALAALPHAHVVAERGASRRS